MNKKLLALVLALTAVATGSSAWATNHHADDLNVTPQKIVSPRVLDHEIGQTVFVTFVIKADGNTAEVTSTDADAHDFNLAARVVAAVEQWEFQPVVDETGAAQAVRVTLPVKLGLPHYKI